MHSVNACTLIIAATTVHSIANGGIEITSTVATFSAGEGLLTPASHYDVSYTNVAGTLMTRVTGDTTFIVPHNPQSNGSLQFRWLVVFRVDDIPVQISNLRYGISAKLVNGGGTTSIPATTLETGFGLLQAVTPETPDLPTNPEIRYYYDTQLQSGNGFVVINENVATPSEPYVLGAGLTYYLLMRPNLHIGGVQGFVGPQVSTTLEFGGDLSSGTYDGFSLGFDWINVPSPTMASIFAVAASTSVFRRQRRSGTDTVATN